MYLVAFLAFGLGFFVGGMYVTWSMRKMMLEKVMKEFDDLHAPKELRKAFEDHAKRQIDE